MQLAVDVILRGVLSAEGEAHPNAEHDGIVLQQARCDKETIYPEIVASRRCKLVILAIEIGVSEEVVHLVRQLSQAKVRDPVDTHVFPCMCVTKCVYMCVTKCVYMCVTKCVYMCVTKCVC